MDAKISEGKIGEKEDTCSLRDIVPNILPPLHQGEQQLYGGVTQQNPPSPGDRGSRRINSKKTHR